MSDDAFTPADARFEQTVRASFGRQGLLVGFGARLALVAPGRVIIELPFSERVGQQQGYFHGAAIGAIGDSAGGYAALTLMPASSEVVTIEYKVNFIRPASGGLLRADGRVARAGKSITVARIEVEVLDGATTRASALLQATYMRVGS